MHNAEIETLIRLDMLLFFVLTKYVVRHMMGTSRGASSIWPRSSRQPGYNGLSVYGATNAASTGFARSLAREVGKLRITVNAIAPSFIETELTRGPSDEARQRIAGRSASRRLPELDDVARMVEYLLGEVGRNITGSILTIDAGNAA